LFTGGSILRAGAKRQLTPAALKQILKDSRRKDAAPIALRPPFPRGACLSQLLDLAARRFEPTLRVLQLLLQPISIVAQRIELLARSRQAVPTERELLRVGTAHQAQQSVKQTIVWRHYLPIQ
jgi:hypothetical protein